MQVAPGAWRDQSKVEVGVLLAVLVSVGLAVGVEVRVGVAVSDPVGVGVCVGITVRVSVSEGEMVAERVWVVVEVSVVVHVRLAAPQGKLSGGGGYASNINQGMFDRVAI